MAGRNVLLVAATVSLMACSGGGAGTAGGTGGATIGESGGSPGGGGTSRVTTASVTGGSTSSTGGIDSGGAMSGGGAGGTIGGGGGTDAGVGDTTGGKTGTGGTSQGGVTGSGGKDAGSGGTSDAGRDSGATGDATGGTTATGGRISSGGTTATGGSGTGGVGTGGAATGGTGTGGAGGATTSSPCPGATQTLTVGAGQQYATVQAAVNAVPSSNNKLVQIAVKAGKYKEQVTINKPFVCLTGESATTTTITNALGTNIVTGGTVLVTGNDFSAANIAFENTGGDGAGQAVALMAQGQRQQFRDCRFLSYQDTLYTNTGTQYFRDCYVQGDVDFIFGDATAVFESCTLNSIAEGTALVAPRTPQNTTYGFVFLGGSLTANPTTSTVRSNHVYLGRPWGPYAAATFLNVAMGAHINADGWTTMSSNTLANTRFSEYKSTGAGANPTNANRATRQLTDAQAASYSVAKVLSPWLPEYSQ